MAMLPHVKEARSAGQSTTNQLASAPLGSQIVMANARYVCARAHVCWSNALDRCDIRKAQRSCLD